MLKKLLLFNFLKREDWKLTLFTTYYNSLVYIMINSILLISTKPI